MKRRYFIPLLIFTAVIGLFLTQKIAFAITVNDLIQTNGTTNVYTCTNCELSQVGQELGNGITGKTTGIFIKGYDQYNDDPYFKLMSNTVNSVSGWTEVLSKRVLDLPNNTTSQIKEITFDSTYTFNPDLYYFIWLDCASTGYGWVRSNEPYDGSNYPYGVPFTYTTGGQISANIDLYFEFISAPSDEVNFVFPENSTSTPDFSHFHLSWNVADTMTQKGIIIVNYSMDADKVNIDTPEKAYNCFYNINGCYRDVLVLENEMASSTDTTLFKHFNLAPALWYSNAELYRDYDADDWIFLASSNISFTITAEAPINTFWDYPTSTITTSTLPQITCDPDDPFFQYSFCKLALYLFIPSSDAFDKFSTLSQEIENKPPIGYFTQIKSALSNVNASGTPVFDIGNYSAFTNNIFSPLRTGMAWLLWLFFAVVIFNRLRHLEL